MAKQYISDLIPGQPVDSVFAVRQKRLVPFRNKPGQYLDLLLADRTGEVIARMWDNAEEAAALFGVGDVVHIGGHVDQYQGRVQIIIQRIRKCGPEEYQPTDFIGEGKLDPAAMMDELRGWVEEVKNPHLRALLEQYFSDAKFLERFAKCPGSKQLHHAHVGGLLEHTLGVVAILDAACVVHPELDRDLLITGALLHDLGKVEELEIVGAAIEYTDIGRLVGHIVLTDRMVAQKLREMPNFPEELAARLTHLLLSHHGQKEYGAPVLPMTPEACALHYADNLDAHVQYFTEVVESGAPGDRWSEYQRLFDRYIYLGRPDEDGSGDSGD
ncbi:MAG: HD domain-containing protein [Armatimonadetes bacterium]|nr:HD domain-containing protein [Armatimonadota bacterium]